MATRIFIDQENGDVGSTLLKDRVKLTSVGKPLVRSQQGKVFGSVPGERTSRKALGNVNKQVTTQKTLQPLKGGLKVKKPAPAVKKVSEAPIQQDEQLYPEIDKFVPYNPADFESFDVPEEHRLSHLSLAGVALMVNMSDARKFDSLLSLEPAPMEMAALSWESNAADHLPSFLSSLEEITVEMPQMLQMATRIFIDQENGDVASTLVKDRVMLTSAGKPLVRGHQGNQGKVFGSASDKTSRKALGNVNKQVTTQKTLQLLKGGLKVKKPAPAVKKVSEAPIKQDEQLYPDIEKFVPYNPADFESFDVPEEHRLSHLSLAGVALMVNMSDARKFDSLLSLEPAPMEMAALSWESNAADCLPSFLSSLEELTVEMPPMLQC
ncbi:uncharacterized protein [Dendropsophus ebraccatus]|uniref:uncharacterized protein n=1 Tax=Dendropsophus ebraccatus TaxID=150705 RepID=UPI0038317874